MTIVAVRRHQDVPKAGADGGPRALEARSVMRLRDIIRNNTLADGLAPVQAVLQRRQTFVGEDPVNHRADPRQIATSMTIPSYAGSTPAGSCDNKLL